MKFTLNHILGACGFIKEGERYTKNHTYEPPEGVKIRLDKLGNGNLKIIISIDEKKVTA